MVTKKIDHLEAPIPPTTCSVHAGTLHYDEKDGTPVTAEFYVRTCADDETLGHSDPEARGDRVDALNQQYTDEVSELMAEGCTNIHYTEVSPSPFF